MAVAPPCPRAPQLVGHALTATNVLPRSMPPEPHFSRLAPACRVLGRPRIPIAPLGSARADPSGQTHSQTSPCAGLPNAASGPSDSTHPALRRLQTSGHIVCY
jgi:hypothetical protein